MDKEKKGIFSNSRQASLMVDTNGNWGPKIKVDDMMKHLKTLGTFSEKLNYIKTYSAKYALVIKYILEHPNDNIFVYNTFVKGSGILVLARLLDLFDFSRSTKGFENNKGKRYAVLTNEMTNPIRTMNIINTFNSPKNVHGEYIQVILGSKITSEGLTFKNVRHVHVLTPFWNFTDIEQAIARTIRLYSHKALIDEGENNPTINIYMHASIPNNKNTDEIEKDWNLPLNEEELESQLEKDLDMMMESPSPKNSMLKDLGLDKEEDTLKDLGLDSDTDEEDTLKDLGLDSDDEDDEKDTLKDLGLDSDSEDEDEEEEGEEEEVNKLSQELSAEMDIVEEDYENIAQELKNNDYSIDLYMYSVSEKKDFLTKKVERLLKESAFDCFLNMDNNQIVGKGAVDGSRECDYTTCVLKCNSTSQNTDGVTFDSYDILYDDEYKSRIVKCVYNFFTKHSKTTIKDLTKYCGKNVREYQVKSVLADLMMTSTYVTNKVGVKSLISYVDDDHIELMYTYSGMDDYYEKNYWIHNENTLKHFIASYLDTKDTIIMKKIHDATDDEEKWSLLQQLTPQHVDDLIKTAVTSTNTSSELRKWILTKFDTSIYHDTDTGYWYIVKNVLAPLRYDGKEWTTLTSSTDEIDTVNKLIIKRFGHPPIKYYAIFNTATKNLLLRSLDNYTSMRKGKGMECTSFTPGDLLGKIILPAGIVIPGGTSLDDAKARKKVSKIFTAEELKDYTKTQVETIFNTVSINKNDICKYIFEWFSENKKIQITF